MQGLSGKTVIVAEDSLGVRQQIVQLYRELGMKVVAECDNGKVVLDKITELSPDLVSLDVIMPEMDGFECARLIKERHPEQKYLFVTWLASDHRILERLKNEMDLNLFVAKPINKVDFVAKIGRVFGVEARLAMPEATMTTDDDLDIPISAS